MDELKDLYETIGFKVVKTYIQSGNVVFTSEEQNTDNLESTIGKHINSKYGYNVIVLVLSPEALEKIVVSVPFADRDISKLHVTFLSNIPYKPSLEKIMDKKSDTELVYIAEKAVYLYCPDGYGKTKLSNSFLEKQLKVTATTRNWKTVNKLRELASEIN
jgi:uncharacterized protein (DUF1697 family)